MYYPRYLLYVSAFILLFVINFIIVTAFTGFSAESFMYEVDMEKPWKPWFRLIVSAILMIVLYTTEVFALVFALRNR